MTDNLTELDKISGIWKYSLGTPCNIYAEWYSIDDFIVEEIWKDNTVLELSNPTLKPSGFPGLFTHFVLVKRNLDLFSTIDILAKKWSVPPQYIFFSGIKDKEAITVQRGCVFGVPPEKIKNTDYPPQIKIFSPIRELRRINIGEHWGNRFTIKLYKVKGSLSHCVELIRETNILNYFGYQRFGIWKPITHIAGKMLISNKLREALLVFLYEVNPLFKNRDKFLRYLSNNEYKKALELLPPRKFDFEKKVLRLLIRRLSEKEILKRIPQSYIRIFIEAYQAFLFNLVLSEIPQKLLDQLKKLPLVGYLFNIEKIEQPVGSVIEKILEKEKIAPSMFRRKYLRPIIARGGYRLSTIRVLDLEVLSKTTDDYSILRFSLRKGSFATIIIRELLGRNTLRFITGRKRIFSEEYNALISYYKNILKRYYIQEKFLRNFVEDNPFL